MKTYKVKEIMKLVEKDGWVFIHQVDSHRQYKHPIKAGRVTISGKNSDDLPTGLLKSILRQAQITLED